MRTPKLRFRDRQPKSIVVKTYHNLKHGLCHVVKLLIYMVLYVFFECLFNKMCKGDVTLKCSVTSLSI